RRAERRPPAGTDLGVLAARAMGAGARPARLAVVVRGRWSGARLDPVLRRAPRSRRDSVLPALRPLPRRLARRGARDRPGAGRGAAGGALRGGRGGGGGAVGRGGGGLGGGGARLRHAPPAAR